MLSTRNTLTFALLLATLQTAWCDTPEPIQAILVTGGCCHDYNAQKQLIADGLSERAHIEVTVVQQGGTTTDTRIPLYEDPDWAKDYDVVIHDECFAEVKDPAWTPRVLKPHQNGIPAVLIHCAMHCYRDGTDQWFKFCGVTSHGHGSHYGHEVLNRDATHPIMKGFGPAWMNPKGELYEITKLWPTARALASSKNREQGNEEICVWTNQYNGTRVFGTTLGHHNETVSNARFLDLLTRGTLWACGKLDDAHLIRPGKMEIIDDEKWLADVDIPDGFNATVFAAPPAVKYPVFVAAAPDGTVYVAVDQNGSLDRELKRGSIYRLRDLDDDGHADEVKLYVADVDSPRGMVWDHDRLYLMHPPHLSAFIDNDADGVSDEQTILVRDIAFTFKDRPADHTSNGVTMGIDGWLYLAIGDFGFMNAVGTDGRALQLRGGGVVRVRPDGSGLESYSNGTRNILEVAVDPLLNGFTRDNTNDGGGWDIRLHHFTGLEDHGYPRLYMNFDEEIVQPLADYGGGSGCGALYMDEPGFPEGMGKALYTADWGREQVFRHTLSPNGATFAPTQDDFVRLPRVTDLDVDANSTLYLASWKGATFKYVGDEVGYLVRMRPKGYQPVPLPDFQSLTESDLIDQLNSPSHRRRLAASRAILRRQLTDSGAEKLVELAANDNSALASRVAAIFTLKQARGLDSHAQLSKWFNVRALQPFVVRALADRWDQTGQVDNKLLSDGLNATNPRTRLESAVAIARLNRTELADNLATLLTDTDAVVAHTVRQALIRLQAAESCLAVFDEGHEPAERVAALRVLQSIHTKHVATELIRRSTSSTDPIRRRELWTAICRLHYVDGEWKGNSWGTRPDTRGPYYQPEPWSETDQIALHLAASLDESQLDNAEFLVQEMSRHRIRLPGMTERLIELVKQSDNALATLLGHLRDEEELTTATKEFIAGLAKRTDLPKDKKKAAIPILLRIESQDSVSTVLNWVIADTQGLAETFGRDKNLAKNAVSLAQLAKSDDAEATMALSGLAVISGRRRLDDETKELAASVLERKWNTNRLQFLEAARTSRNRDLSDKVKLALTDEDAKVATLATEIAGQWKILAEPIAAGPRIKSLEPAVVLSQGIQHTGSVDEGKELFERLQCGKCHTVKPGEALRGPYLPNVAKTYKRNQLAEAVLQPNKSIAQGFVTNLFVLDDGRQIIGFVTNEGVTELTVRDREGTELKIPVESVEERATQNVSAMPEGLIDEITTEQFGSLVSYLESLGGE